MKKSDVLVAFGVFLIVILIIVPLNPTLLDFLLIVNISLSVLILLLSMFTREALEFSAFPTLLLIMTLFRLALNISSTRLILSNNGEAGAVIRTFGGFVIGDNIAVGLIIFLIIIVIQFIVITKGAERVAEVAARFTLDAMPGKQMAIDADLNAGLITEEQARIRRNKIQREADFYGSMDGASKFVKGDAIVGILITVINLAGGIIIGITMSGLTIDEVIRRYTFATVGDGLVSQIPALLISTATGIIVTRAASENNLGHELNRQMTAHPTILLLSGVMIFALGLIPGLPKLPITLLSLFMITLGLMIRKQRVPEGVPFSEVDEVEHAVQTEPEEIADLLRVDPVELELGYGLIALADPEQGGDLPERINLIRRQFAAELGLIVPGIRLHDNVLLQPNEYVVRIRGETVAEGEVMPEYLLALHANETDTQIAGMDTTDPSFGLPAKWIRPQDREKAENLGYTVVDPSSVIATHLSEVLHQHAHELLDRQQVQQLIDWLRQEQPVLVDEVIPKQFSLGEVQKVLEGLLAENVPIRDMGTILETMADTPAQSRQTDLLVERVRQRLHRTITRRFVEGNKARVITLDPKLEGQMLEKVRHTDQGSFIALAPDQIRQLLHDITKAAEEIMNLGSSPIVLTSPGLRPHFKRLTEHVVPGLIVLSYNEIDQQVEIQSEKMISLPA